MNVEAPNDPSSATGATRRVDCNRDGPPMFAAPHGQAAWSFISTRFFRLALLFSRMSLEVFSCRVSGSDELRINATSLLVDGAFQLPQITG